MATTGRIVHLANGDTFVVKPHRANTFGDPVRPAKPTRIAQIAASAAERRRIDGWHREELLGRPPPSERTYARKPLIDRAHDQCAWPVGRNECCGHRTEPRKSYCRKHAVKASGGRLR